MGKDPIWQHHNINKLNDQRPPDISQQNMNSIMFQDCVNTHGCDYNANGTTPFPGFAAQGFHSITSASYPFLSSMNIAAGVAANHKGLLVFDHSGDKMNLIFGSVSPPFHKRNLNNNDGVRHASNKTNVYDSNAITDTHENTEEIDALLYSDSYEVHEEEDEASTGHSPFTFSGTVDNLSPSLPSKRRRIEKENDKSLSDTASSGLVYNHKLPPHHTFEDGDESSCVGGGFNRSPREYCNRPVRPALFGSNRKKREKIRETVGILRGMIPGGDGKDAVTVLDEAIRYLKSLRLKAKTIPTTYF